MSFFIVKTGDTVHIYKKGAHLIDLGRLGNKRQKLYSTIDQAKAAANRLFGSSSSRKGPVKIPGLGNRRTSQGQAGQIFQQSQKPRTVPKSAIPAGSTRVATIKPKPVVAGASSVNRALRRVAGTVKGKRAVKRILRATRINPPKKITKRKRKKRPSSDGFIKG